MGVRIGALARGVATYIPGVTALYRRMTSTGGTDTPRYCYAVWLRHLVMSYRNGLCTEAPRRVAELGPGDSIGIGLCALLSGAERYYGLDVLPLADIRRNLAIFERLTELFLKRAPIPDPTEFPELQPTLDSYAFPRQLVRFSEDRIAAIRASIEAPRSASSLIRYVAPWWSSQVIEPGGVDMIFSQAVLEHVDDLEAAYEAMKLWLSDGGWMSHQIDFRCHATGRRWNDHWTFPDWLWALLRGRRTYFINRMAYSDHLALLTRQGFQLVADHVLKSKPIARQRLAPAFRRLTDADLTTCCAFIQARKLDAHHGEDCRPALRDTYDARLHGTVS